MPLCVHAACTSTAPFILYAFFTAYQIDPILYPRARADMVTRVPCCCQVPLALHHRPCSRSPGHAPRPPSTYDYHFVLFFCRHQWSSHKPHKLREPKEQNLVLGVQFIASLRVGADVDSHPQAHSLPGILGGCTARYVRATLCVAVRLPTNAPPTYQQHVTPMSMQLGLPVGPVCVAPLWLIFTHVMPILVVEVSPTCVYQPPAS